MDIINKTVRHRVFGVGTVCGLEENVVSVRFGGAVRRFLFPDAFRDFLSMTEQQDIRRVDSLLEALDADARVQRDRARREAERRRLLRRLPLNTSAQAAFGFLHNDIREAAADWRLNTGRFRSGYNRGKPRVPARLYPNSACLLTCRPENAPESARVIWGACMVPESFIGPECADGLIPAHAKYRLLLTEAERGRLRFWDYISGGDASERKWGPVEFRYFPNVTMARILRDMHILLRGTDRQALCGEFLDYFCALNKVSARLPKSAPGIDIL